MLDQYIDRSIVLKCSVRCMYVDLKKLGLIKSLQNVLIAEQTYITRIGNRSKSDQKQSATKYQLVVDCRCCFCHIHSTLYF